VARRAASAQVLNFKAGSYRGTFVFVGRVQQHLSERFVGGKILRRCVKNHTKHNQEAASMAGNSHNQQAGDPPCGRGARKKSPIELQAVKLFVSVCVTESAFRCTLVHFWQKILIS
jgi:hypothetical protein